MVIVENYNVQIDICGVLRVLISIHKVNYIQIWRIYVEKYSSCTG